MHSYTCTVHNVQGLSLTLAVVSFDLQKQKSFNEAQMYVVLSRATSIIFFLLENVILMFSKLMKVLLLNIVDYQKTDSKLLIQIMLTVIVL